MFSYSGNIFKKKYRFIFVGDLRAILCAEVCSGRFSVCEFPPVIYSTTLDSEYTSLSAVENAYRSIHFVIKNCLKLVGTGKKVVVAGNKDVVAVVVGGNRAVAVVVAVASGGNRAVAVAGNRAVAVAGGNNYFVAFGIVGVLVERILEQKCARILHLPFLVQWCLLYSSVWIQNNMFVLTMNETIAFASA